MWNSPLSWTDPTGLTASGEYGGATQPGRSSAGGLAAIGRNLSCIFFALADVFDVAGDTDTIIDDVIVDAGSGRCGAKTRPKPKPKPRQNKRDDGGSCPIGGSPFSFPASVQVWTEDGFVAVEDIAVGDRVYAWDAEAGERVLSSVADTFGRTSTDMVEIGYRNDRGETGSFRVTPEHPFATLDGALDGGWAEAGGLMPGQVIFDVDGGEGATVVSVRHEKTKEPVYNFEVAGTHSYFVGDDGLLTHNARKASNKLKPDQGATGDHTVFRRDKCGKIIHYQTFYREPRAPNGWRPGPRFRGEGGPHGGMNPPYINEGGRARAPSPGELPPGY